MSEALRVVSKGHNGLLILCRPRAYGVSPPALGVIKKGDTAQWSPSHLLLIHERPADFSPASPSRKFEQLLQPTFALYMHIRK